MTLNKGCGVGRAAADLSGILLQIDLTISGVCGNRRRKKEKKTNPVSSHREDDNVSSLGVPNNIASECISCFLYNQYMTHACPDLLLTHPARAHDPSTTYASKGGGGGGSGGGR